MLVWERYLDLPRLLTRRQAIADQIPTARELFEVC